MSTPEIDSIRAAAQPLTGAPADYDALSAHLSRVGRPAKIVV